MKVNMDKQSIIDAWILYNLVSNIIEHKFQGYNV